MSRVAREKYKTGFFHIMIQGINKEYIFEKNENKEKYLFLMKKYYENYNIKIIAYCIMNNHAHFLIYSDDIKQISNYMHKINSIYAMDYNTINKRVGYLFRDRYKSQYINNREYLFKCIKYIHLNPVKAHIVKEERQYKYSSYNDFLYKKEYIKEHGPLTLPSEESTALMIIDTKKNKLAFAKTFKSEVSKDYINE